MLFDIMHEQNFFLFNLYLIIFKTRLVRLNYRLSDFSENDENETKNINLFLSVL